MKRYLTLILVAVAVAAGSFGLTRGLLARGDEDQIVWLRREFRLTDDQAAAIARLQANYQPVCMAHCRLILAARDRLAATPGDTTAQAEITRLEGVCAQATLAHLREIAAQMDSAQGRRFLTLVEPRVSRHEHQGPLGLK